MSRMIGISFASTLTFIIFGFYLYKNNKPFFPYVFIIYFSQLWAVLSSTYIETGVFITEQGRYSFPTGSTFRLVLYNFVFFMSLNFFLKFLSMFKKKGKKTELKYYGLIEPLILTIIFVISLVLYFNLLFSGIPPLSGGIINRFNFWSDYAVYPQLLKVYGWLYFFSFLLGVIFSSTEYKKYKKGALIGLLSFIVLQVLHGSYFPYLVVCFFFLPVAVLKINKNEKIMNIRTILVFSLFILAVLSFKFLEYKYFHKIENPVEMILFRIFGLQGHTWWGTDMIVQTTNFNYYEHLIQEFTEILYPTIDRLQTGMRFLMVLISEDIGRSFIQKGVNFSTAYPAIAVVTFGPVGAFFAQIFFASILSVLIVYLDNKIKARSYFRLVIAVKLFFSYFAVLSMGNFVDFFNYKTLIYIFILFLFESGVHLSKKNSLKIKLSKKKMLTYDKGL